MVLEEMGKVKEAADFMNDQFEKFKKLVSEVSSATQAMQKRLEVTENAAKCSLEGTEDLKQYTQRNNIVVSGIPETPNEDVYDLVIITARELGISLSYSNIDIAHQIPTKSLGPKKIIVRLVNRWKKE